MDETKNTLAHKIATLKQLGFTYGDTITKNHIEMALEQIPDEWKIDKEEFKYLLTPKDQFIEQRGLNEKSLSSGFGVAATLSDGSIWNRETDLTDEERFILVAAGIKNESLDAQAAIATKH